MGAVEHAMDVSRDKANKVLWPQLCAIARFKIPVRTSIRLIHTGMPLILLYNAENWVTLTELQEFSNNVIFDRISNFKFDNPQKTLQICASGVQIMSKSYKIW